MSVISQFVEDLGGVASVAELADHLDVDEGVVRAFARRNAVRRLGSTFAFDVRAAEALYEAIFEEDEGEEEDDEDDEDDAMTPNASEGEGLGGDGEGGDEDDDDPEDDDADDDDDEEDDRD